MTEEQIRELVKLEVNKQLTLLGVNFKRFEEQGDRRYKVAVVCKYARHWLDTRYYNLATFDTKCAIMGMITGYKPNSFVGSIGKKPFCDEAGEKVCEWLDEQYEKAWAEHYDRMRELAVGCGKGVVMQQLGKEYKRYMNGQQP